MRRRASRSPLSVCHLRFVYSLYIDCDMRDDVENRVATVRDLIDRLGGKEAAMTALDANEGQVNIWLHRGSIPPKHYLKHSDVLGARAIVADPALWKMAPPATGDPPESAAA